MPRSDYRFAWKKRVRYAEIDAQAVVYNSRYLEYFDLALTEYWREAGLYDHTTVAGGLEFGMHDETLAALKLGAGHLGIAGDGGVGIVVTHGFPFVRGLQFGAFGA